MPLALSLLAAATAPAMTCSALAGTYAEVTIDRASEVTPAQKWSPDSRGNYATGPIETPLCRIEGRIEGSIGFELWLPMTWNGRMLGAGVGSDAGVFNYRDMALRSAQGFATVTTDSGHKASNARWMREPKARVDYEHRATHLTAQAAKALIAKYYGRPADKAYFLGCSGGGRQGLKEMENYPEDYDGIVAGAPGPYMPLQSVRMLWFSLEQARSPAGMLRDEDWALYEAKVTATCDPLDGVTDGIIENPAACRFASRSLLCKPGQTKDCLTAPRLAMLDRIVAPMPDERGRAMDKGLFAGVRTRPGPPSPLLRAMWADAVYDNPEWDAETFRRTEDLAAVNRLMPELRADKTAIQPFVRRGNKAIIYQGWQDPSVNAGPTIDFYAALAKANGGLARLQDSVRLFMVPGMYHCRGGPGADGFGGSTQAGANGDPHGDILWALINWVEQGTAPTRVVAAKRLAGKPAITRALCPFPQAARYMGGDQASAASFECQAAPSLTRMLR